MTSDSKPEQPEPKGQGQGQGQVTAEEERVMTAIFQYLAPLRFHDDGFSQAGRVLRAYVASAVEAARAEWHEERATLQSVVKAIRGSQSDQLQTELSRVREELGKEKQANSIMQKAYFDLADAVAPSSASTQHLCEQARETRDQLTTSRAEHEKTKAAVERADHIAAAARNLLGKTEAALTAEQQAHEATKRELASRTEAIDSLCCDRTQLKTKLDQARTEVAKWEEAARKDIQAIIAHHTASSAVEGDHGANGPSITDGTMPTVGEKSL